jgi:hypothetical protein
MMKIFRWINCALGLFAVGTRIEDLIIPDHALELGIHRTNMLTGSVLQHEQLPAEWAEHGPGMGSNGHVSDGGDCTKT